MVFAGTVPPPGGAPCGRYPLIWVQNITWSGYGSLETGSKYHLRREIQAMTSLSRQQRGWRSQPVLAMCSKKSSSDNCCDEVENPSAPIFYFQLIK
jgi:hypothetical protein